MASMPTIKIDTSAVRKALEPLQESATLHALCAEAIAELGRARRLHHDGQPARLPNGSSEDMRAICDSVRASVDAAHEDGTLTHAGIALEEICEAMCEEDEDALDEELNQAIAMLLAWRSTIAARRAGRV